jgi:hypothetical protein
VAGAVHDVVEHLVEAVLLRLEVRLAHVHVVPESQLQFKKMDQEPIFLIFSHESNRNIHLIITQPRVANLVAVTNEVFGL